MTWLDTLLALFQDSALAAFPLSGKLPQTISMSLGQVRISGGPAALGLDFCGGRLAQFRLTYRIGGKWVVGELGRNNEQP